MAAAVPISLYSAPRRKAIAVAMAALGVMALFRLAAPASDSAPLQHPRQSSRFADAVFRQPPGVTVSAAAPGGSARGACVMALGASEKVSVGLEGTRSRRAPS
jgi:hypothetical protein